MSTSDSRPSSLRFVFLVYASRSGSTLLARLLAESSPSLAVLPEFRLPRLLLWFGDCRVRGLGPNELFALMKQDLQAAAVGLDDAALLGIARRTAGAGIRSVLEAIALEYARRRSLEPSIAVLKGGHFLRFAESLEAMFPDAAFLHVIRDGRGVANSMMKSRNPHLNNSLVAKDDVVYCAWEWKKAIRRAESVAAKGSLPVVTVSYEELLEHKEPALLSVLSALGADVARDQAGLRYFHVAEKERELHPLVQKAPAQERADAWKHELRPWQGVLFETLAGRELARHGYELWYLPRTSRQRRIPMLVGGYLHHLVRVPQRCWQLLAAQVTRRWSLWKRVRQTDGFVRATAAVGHPFYRY